MPLVLPIVFVVNNNYCVTSAKVAPVLVAVNVSVMKLIDLVGLTKISAKNSPRSCASGGLLL